MAANGREGSSISGRSKGKAFREVIENQKMKMVQIIHVNSLDHKPEVKLDIFKLGLNMAGSSSSKVDINNKGKGHKRHYHHHHHHHERSQRTHSSKFCKREFSSPQALGGHQNAHKQERATAKQRQAAIISDHHRFGVLRRNYSPYFPYYDSKYPHYANNPPINYGSFDYNRPFGVKLEFMMIHKPSYNPNFIFRHDYQTLDRLGASSGTSRKEEIGIISSSSATTDTTIGDQRIKFISEKAPKEDDDNLDSSGLDLSLKL